MEDEIDNSEEKPLKTVLNENKSELIVQKQVNKIPQKQDYHIAKFASMLLIVSFIGVLLSVLSVLSFLAIAVYYLILVIILFLSLFILLPKLKPWFDKGQEVQDFITSTQSLLPYVLGASIFLSLCALFIFIFKKNYINKTSRIIFTSIVLFIALAILIVRYLLLNN